MIKTVYQKHIQTSARVGYTPPVWKQAQVKGLQESRLTIGGDEDWNIVSPEEVWTIPAMYSECNALGKIRTRLNEDQAHQTYRPLDDHLVILTTSKAFDYFRAWRDEIRITFHITKFVD